MGATAVIKEYLASVGFQADEKSLKKSLTMVAAFGAAVQMTAVGIYAGLIKVASGEVEIARKAELLGTTSDKLQELGYVAQQSGSSVDALNRSMESLTKKNPRIRDAARALELAGQRMRGMTDIQRRAYADNMGIDRTLIPMLISDTSALADEFRAMYAVAGYDAQKAAKASQEFTNELGKLSTMAGLLAKSVSLTFVDKIRHDVAHLRRVFMENFDKIKLVLEGAVSIVLRVAAAISGFVYRVSKWIGSLLAWFNRLDDGQRKAIIGLGLLLAAWKLLNAGFLATPLGMIITGLAAIVALVDDFLTYMEGGESYFDWSPWAATIMEVVQALKPILGVIVAIGKGIVAAIGPAIRTVLTAIGQLMTIIRQFTQYLMAFFTGDLGRAAELTEAMFTGLVDMLVGLFTGWLEVMRTILGSLWDGVLENFPDFGAWAAGAVRSIKEVFGIGIAWIKDKIDSIVGFLPDWVKAKIGLAVDGDEAPQPAGDDTDFEQAINDAIAAAQAASAPALTPSPAQAASLATHQQELNLNARTEIHMHTSDPVAAGNQVADRQAQVNADTVRHMRGVVR